MKGRVTKELEQSKSLSLKIQEARCQKMLWSLKEKGKLGRSFSTYTKYGNVRVYIKGREMLAFRNFCLRTI